ncbi:MAG: cytochrome c3 family protein [Planctomycetota bacterium]|jgi:predicted CXXCH cytochrome family protein
MRKLIFFGICICLGAFTVTARGAIGGTGHDFSGETWSGDEICAPCHVVHSADPCEGAPLWSHEVIPTGKTYTPYTSTTIDINEPGYVGGSVTFTGTSKLCLSCHDGSIALDSFDGATGSTFIDDIGTGSGRVTDAADDTDLSRMHPIGFRYRNALVLADGELHDPATVDTSDVVLEDYTDADTGGLVTCSSCHDVHNSVSADPLLVMDNTGSTMCLVCHDK